MDKKKVKELLNKALNDYNQVETCDDGSHCALISMGASIEKALKELSKSDWVSVEDRQPAKNVVVRVCNKQNPDDLILAYRTNKETMKIVYPNNVAMYTITHWKPIEKLEE